MNYKVLPNFSKYKIYEDGSVTSTKSKENRTLKPQTIHQTRGYQAYTLYTDAKEKVVWTVHKLVVTAFNRAPGLGEVVDHVDNNPRNNNLSNLQIITQSENVRKEQSSRQAIKTILIHHTNKEKYKFNSTMEAARFIHKELNLTSQVHSVRDRIVAVRNSEKTLKAYKTYFCYRADNFEEKLSRDIDNLLTTAIDEMSSGAV